ncbi:hypothetical protein [Boudabousia marimammalium]|uniref:Primosomal protein N' 3' DNA-binding domain-containing protein n=1 Tax=Boudabousia marimammalium TaxID=156892 RepID=A0A1Q5PRG4_9ACTO|nr:hypothetical protein [Boudabousia marimammalium]OKL50000.1 hypothetical protein BM477_03655 [Boudabousia marimammalium]
MSDLLSSLPDSEATFTATSRVVDSEVPLPVAQVILDVKVAHLDQMMDYLVPASLTQSAQIGAKVKVPLGASSKLGWIVGRSNRTSHGGALRPISAVVSQTPVLTPEILSLSQRLAQARVGTVAHILRSAIPGRHARTEKTVLSEGPVDFPSWQVPAGSTLSNYQRGAAFLQHLGAGEGPRALWPYLPSTVYTNEYQVPDYYLPVADAVQACLASGRSAIIVAPTAAVVEEIASFLELRLPDEPVSRLHQELSPAARYRSHLHALLGRTRVVVGTRNVVYSPLRKLGLIVLFDASDKRLVAQRSPYTPAHEVAALRAIENQAALLVAGLILPAWAQRWENQAWAFPLTAPRELVRRSVPRVEIPDDYLRLRDGASAYSRLPSSAYQVIKEGLISGPVLVHVERAGYIPALSCAQCFRPVKCDNCGGPVQGTYNGNRCANCGQPQQDFSCPSCSAKQIRSVRIGAERTAEEFGRSFPSVPITVSSANTRVIEKVNNKPRIVIATAHAAPRAEGGFAAAVILDPNVALNHPSADAAEQAVATWFEVAAKVRVDGTVMVAGEIPPEYGQPLIRWNPQLFTGWAYRQYEDANLAPAVWAATVLGSPRAVQRFAELVKEDEFSSFSSVYGPFPAIGEQADEAQRVLGESNPLVVHYSARRAEGFSAAGALRRARAVTSASDDDKLLVRVH